MITRELNIAEPILEASAWRGDTAASTCWVRFPLEEARALRQPLREAAELVGGTEAMWENAQALAAAVGPYVVDDELAGFLAEMGTEINAGEIAYTAPAAFLQRDLLERSRESAWSVEQIRAEAEALGWRPLAVYWENTSHQKKDALHLLSEVAAPNCTVWDQLAALAALEAHSIPALVLKLTRLPPLLH